METGEFNDRRWRHATDGGWFSYTLKVLPDQPQELLVIYWGSDAGGREFDILIDGQKLATQKLESNKPGQFYDQMYPLPKELIGSKDQCDREVPGASGPDGRRFLRLRDSEGEELRRYCDTRTILRVVAALLSLPRRWEPVNSRHSWIPACAGDDRGDLHAAICAICVGIVCIQKNGAFGE